MKKNRVLLFLGLIVVLLFYFFIIKKTTWGGWVPEDRSLVLNSNEKKWISDFEKENNCKFNYIGLDKSYMEDSIIYMNLYLNKNSIIEQKILEEGYLLITKICKSFLARSKNQKKKNCIQIIFENLKLKDHRYPTTLKYMYTINLGVVTKVE